MLKIALAVSLALAQIAAAEWKIVSESNESSVSGTVTHRHLVLEDSAKAERATLELASFSNKDATLRVLDSPGATASLAEAMQREKCSAGVNGGYFDPEYAPVGLSISDGRMLAPLGKAKLLSGVVSVSNGRVIIQRAAQFSMKAKAKTARQCGPFLVENGKALANLNASRSARRTFVATADERAMLGFCSSVTLARLADMLAAGDWKVQRALNLDGGSSSGFWFNGASGVFSIGEQKSVRDFLAIVPKR